MDERDHTTRGRWRLPRRFTAKRFTAKRFAPKRFAPKRFAHDESGAHAVEFAILAPVFLFMIFAVFETAAVYWGDRLLNSFAADVARQARTDYTGMVTYTDADGNEQTRPEDLCRDRAVGLLLSCDKILVDIRPVSDKSSLRKDGKIDPTKFKIAPGDTGSINIARVYLDWPRLFDVPIVPAGTPNIDGNVELYGAVAFVKE